VAGLGSHWDGERGCSHIFLCNTGTPLVTVPTVRRWSPSPNGVNTPWRGAGCLDYFSISMRIILKQKNLANGLVDLIKIGLGMAALAALTGCIGVADGGGGGYYGGAVVVAEPDMYVFGGGYERGRDVHDYSHRGVESRAVAHPVEARAAPPHQVASHAPASHPGGGEKKR
jgi:hypothetical protein